ncbi:gamma-interferon-responsive lysosomal thiol protein isoform X3 [Gossypium hirsutum]|uniref:Gamma-interferon-responsive lysosomal thiol protein isoform X3 n=1 Tax=Gossypium hirsutum TaxID=3635 RepID=A0ABM2ZVM9_GOSHI|nr:gamma-interferon-responsive lysosomal thiol protein-like isoform X3 [Gossypium hirsutum]
MSFSKLLSLLLLVNFIFIYQSHSSPDNNVTKAQSHIKPKKVHLSLYYESLCPYCRSFIVSQLVKVFNTDLLNIINLRLVPWGNAQYVKPKKTIICQHGEDECYLNTIHACAISIWPDPAFPSRIISTLTVWKQCGKPALPDPVWIRNSSRTAMTVDMEESFYCSMLLKLIISIQNIYMSPG